MTDRPIIIELVGPSGSGKSTFVSETVRKSKAFDNLESAAFRGLIYHSELNLPGASLLRRIPMPIARRLRLTKLTNLYRDQLLRLYGGRYDALLECSSIAIAALPIPVEEKYWLIGKIRDAVTNYILITHPINAGRIILADELFLQKIHSLFFNQQSGSLDHSKVQQFLDIIPPPNRILHFTIDPTVCAQRLLSRGRTLPRMSRAATMEEIAYGLKQSLNTSKYIVQYLSDATHCTVDEVTHTTDLGQLRKELTASSAHTTSGT